MKFRDELMQHLKRKGDHKLEQNKEDQNEEEIDYFLHFLGSSKDKFRNYCVWQLSFISAAEFSKSDFYTMCVFVKENGTEEGYKTHEESINAIIGSHFPDFKTTQTSEELGQQITEFHVALFSELDSYSKVELQPKITQDVSFMLQFCGESRTENEAVRLALMFEWTASLCEALSISTNSLIRLLGSVNLFLPDERKFNLANHIEKLKSYSAPNPKSEPAEIEEEVQNIVVAQHIELFKEIEEHSKPIHKTAIENDLKRHCEFLDQSIQSESPVIFTEYIKWVNSTLEAIGINTYTLLRFLVSMRMVIKRTNNLLPLTYIDGSIQQITNNLKEGNQGHSNSYLNCEEAKEYLDYLLDGNRKKATDFILKLADDGMPLSKIYIDIFQNSQYEIGRLWEENKVSVAQEHYCTATTQMIMSMLYPRLFSTKRNDKNVVATCVGSELHEIGIRMVADFFEMNGWNSYYIGANTPTNAILESIEMNNADILALSVTLTPHINRAKEIILEVKKAHPKVKVMVGGYPFIQDPELWEKIGADSVASSALDLHEKALSILNE